MNKKNKIIATALASGVLGGGIALTTIAQGCTDDTTPSDPQQEEAISTIMTELNAVTSYRAGDLPEGILWQLLRLAINGSDSAAVNVLEWNFSTISAGDISVSGYDYTVQLNNFQGLFNDGQVVAQENPSASVTWVLENRNVNDSIGQLALRTVSLNDISASRQNDQAIIAEVNTLSEYDGSSQLSGLALELLTAIESNIASSYPFGALTLSSLNFSQLNSSRVFPFNTSGLNNIYSVNIDITSGVASSGSDTISVAGSMIIAVNNSKARPESWEEPSYSDKVLTSAMIAWSFCLEADISFRETVLNANCPMLSFTFLFSNTHVTEAEGFSCATTWPSLNSPWKLFNWTV